MADQAGLAGNSGLAAWLRSKFMGSPTVAAAQNRNAQIDAAAAIAAQQLANPPREIPPAVIPAPAPVVPTPSKAPAGYSFEEMMSSMTARPRYDDKGNPIR